MLLISEFASDSPSSATASHMSDAIVPGPPAVIETTMSVAAAMTKGISSEVAAIATAPSTMPR